MLISPPTMKRAMTHTPSPLAKFPIHSRTRSDSNSSARSTSPASPFNNSEQKKKKVKPKKGVGSTPLEDSIVDINSPAISPLCRSLFNPGKCPCNISTGDYLIDCSSCRQFWHLKCVTLDGLVMKEVNKLLKWKCPFCYVAPLSTTDSSDMSSCLTCRNTRTLRDANHAFESTKAAANLASLPSDATAHAQTRLFNESLDILNKNIANLQADINSIATRPCSSAHPPPASENSHELLADINEQLKQICSAEPVIADGIKSLQNSISALESAGSPPTPPQHQVSSSQPTNTPPALPPHPVEADDPVPHGQKPVLANKSDFIESSECEQLTAFLDSCTYKSENGHSVCSFGEPYFYTGSKSSKSTAPMPNELKPILDKLNSIQSELFKSKYPKQTQSPPVINSCLINRYEGPDSFLPKHSDKEVTIHPESCIFTLSVGQNCTIKFTDCQTGDESLLDCPDRSLYYMTRRSQEVFSHQIEKGSVSSGVRFSLTFRAVDWRHKNSTCLIGDSNTGFLRFGSCKRSTFGELMPGQKFWSPRIEDINPEACMGYANVVLLCGINDVRRPDVNNDSDIVNYYHKLKLKVKQIEKLSPSTSVFVCRLLPTRDFHLNQKVNRFNELIYFDLEPTCKNVQWVDGFEKFSHNHVLVWELSKQFDTQGRPDTLHLNRSGVRVLARLIKSSIFLRLHGGRDRRRHSGRVDGRLYRTVVGDPPPAR